MVSRALKLRVRRRLRLRKRQVEAIGSQAEEQLERNLFRRLERLHAIRRFMAGWIVLTVLLFACTVVQIRALGGYYQTIQPVAGGTINEGVVGSFTNANPVYATSSVDLAVSRLLFASLYSYNDKNQLAPDLAAAPYVVSPDGTQYTVKLREGVRWHDGKPLTAQDVVFTFAVIQNPDARSPLNASWQDIKVAAPDAHTITFTLPDPLAAFPSSLTTGIIPKHILGATPMSAMRSSDFNTSNTVGSGPFRWQAIEVTGGSPQDRQERVALQRYDDYHRGPAKLANFVIHSFRSQTDMIQSFHQQEINAMAGLSEVPSQFKKDSSVYSYNLPLTAAVMTFFKTSEGVLAETAVRKALVYGADQQKIIDSLGYATKPVREPLLQGQLGYDPSLAQPGYDVNAARKTLDDAGWLVGKDGIRYKNKQPLTFKLYAEETSEYSRVAKLLQDQWRAVGVNVTLEMQKAADFQSTLAFHSYDALLYGISIGNDPDVYAYWSSAQADLRATSRLNFSEFKSATADAALESGRTRTDAALRAVKYRPFLQVWQKDAPALGMYQPRFLYITRGQLFGLKEHYINTPADRMNSINQWMIRQAAVSQAKSE
jgi:peptide/nickel transport system substrate-binding protein